MTNQTTLGYHVAMEYVPQTATRELPLIEAVELDDAASPPRFAHKNFQVTLCRLLGLGSKSNEAASILKTKGREESWEKTKPLGHSN